MTHPDGTTATATIRPTSPYATDGWRWMRDRSTPDPLAFRDNQDRTGETAGHDGHGRNYWFESIPGADAVYVKFNVVRNDAEPFADFCERMFTHVDETGAERLIIDLRHNGGGNNQILLPLIHGIIKRDAINRPGHLFTITGPRTFSAAMRSRIPCFSSSSRA